MLLVLGLEVGGMVVRNNEFDDCGRHLASLTRGPQNTAHLARVLQRILHVSVDLLNRF